MLYIRTLRMLSRRQFTGGFAAAAWYASTGMKEASGLNSMTAQSNARRPMIELQQDFSDLRFGMYIHLNMATYEGREWGDPKASPQIFNPQYLNTPQCPPAPISPDMP